MSSKKLEDLLFQYLSTPEGRLDSTFPAFCHYLRIKDDNLLVKKKMGLELMAQLKTTDRIKITYERVDNRVQTVFLLDKGSKGMERK
ncbi:hypothetical protein ACFFIF_09880 [Vagococcus entomophilus]|uniref:Uncharacterized protein n=1 Tax=Vagococcus entomophilus TaxID=1160095 RepID=A0A430AGA8_9ENTE|nr:hypothetical protein [Vagococcus entomophilus]RSU06945.1 hypothetical protein CBF30_06705 [Vagococcus entomophilus]